MKTESDAMFKPIKSPLGEVLQYAGLVSVSQISLALQEQKQHSDLRIGEILALRGWIAQKTADFFAEQWPMLLTQKSQQPIGYYLEQAGLLNSEQINDILAEQDKLWLRFGAVAVLKGWLKETTLKFFLSHLFPEALSKSVRRDRQNKFNLSPDLAEKQSPSPTKKTEEVDLEEIPWID